MTSRAVSRSAVKPPVPGRGQAAGGGRGRTKNPNYRALEQPIHRAILNYLRLALPGAVIHHSPNAMNLAASPKSKAIAQKRAKDDGMLPGWPDLIVVWRDAGGTTHVWGFEVKPEGRTPTDDQVDVGSMLERNGARWAVVRSVDDAAEAVREWRGAIE